MNLIRCAKGHFYDEEKHGKVCPYCEETAAEKEIEAQADTKEELVVEPRNNSNPLQMKPAKREIEEDDNVTVGYFSKVIGVEPVVGWLVCIKGEYRGESFKLKSGRNFIGRAANMDIVLSADYSISRNKHAAVVYEPRSRQFIVTAGDSRGLSYLNGEVILSNMKMNAYDVLEIGATSMMLIPCCGENFSWDELE